MTDQTHLEPAVAFAQLAQIDLTTAELGDVLTRIAELAQRTIPGASDVSVTLLREDQARTAAFTGVLALDLDEEQYERGHGPCLEAGMGGLVLHVADMATEQRWPDYTPRAVERGAHSSLSVGLPIQQTVLGALNIYATERNAFDDDSVVLAQTFAGYAAVALANAHLYASTAALAGQMQDAMASRSAIEQAKGILMAQRRCTAEQAFDELARQSQLRDVKVRDVAREIVAEAQQGGRPSS